MSKYYTDKCFCGLKSACPLAPYNFSDQAFCFLCFFLDQVGPIIPLHLSTSVVVAQNIHRLQVNQLSENVSLPPQMWSLLCQEELTLLHWPPEICTKVVMIQLQVLDQTMKFSLLLPSLRTGWTQNLSFFLFLFRNIWTSSSALDVNFIFFTVSFWGQIFCRNTARLVHACNKFASKQN